MKSTFLLLLAASVGLTSGCGTKQCRPNTALITVDYDGTTASADQILVSLSFDGEDTPQSSTVMHSPGLTSGTVEIDFAKGYQPGRSLTVAVVALRNGAQIGSASQTFALTTSCTVRTVFIAGDNTVGSSDLPDLANPPDMANTEPPDMTMLACTLGATRCNATNHAVMQTCDASGTWQDSACGANMVCTDAKGKCIDPLWVQWSYTVKPSQRFSTINDTTGPGEDIVKDAWTGLSWQLKHPDATYTWSQGVAYCDALSYGGFSDWRIPTPTELTTLLDRRIGPGSNPPYPPVIFAPFPANTKPEYYWTVLPYPGGLAWVTDFGSGVQNAYTATEAHRVRCVR